MRASLLPGGEVAAAHVGVAMGRHGSDLALKTAAVVMVQDQLTALPAASDLSRRARVVTANLAFEAIVIATLVFLDLAALGEFGGANQERSTAVVELNARRLLRSRNRRRP